MTRSVAGFRRKRISKIVAAVACVALVVGLLPAPALAGSDGALDNTAPGAAAAPPREATPLEAAKVSMVEAEVTLTGSGTQADPYLVNNKSELRAAVDANENPVYIKLNSNITLTDPNQYGYHVQIIKNVDLDLNGKSITESSAQSEYSPRVIFEVGGETGSAQLTLRGSGEVNCVKGFAFVGPNDSFIMENGTINGIRGVEVSGGTFTMNGGTINATGSGNFDYGVRLLHNSSKNGTFTMNGGTIKTGANTHGVSILQGSTFTMNGGTIKAEGASAHGVNVDKGTITMNGGTISSKHSYGVDLCASDGEGSFTMHGGTVSSEESVGMYIINGDSFQMDGGTVTSESNWSVRVVEGSFTMDGGTVSSGVSVGVHVDSDGSFTMRGGTVKSEGSFESGVLVESGGSFTINCGTVASRKQAVSGYGQNTKTGVGWTDFDGTEGREEIAVSSAREYSNYKRISFPLYDVAVSVSPAGNGTVSGGGAYAYGESATMKATADAGYHLASWTEDGAVVSTDANYSFDVTSNRTLVANFEKDEYTCAEGSGTTWTKGSSDPLTLTFKSTGDDSAMIDLFTGVEVDDKAVPQKDSSGKTNWTIKKGSVILSLQPSFLETLGVGDHTVKALFANGSSQASFTVKAAPAASAANVASTAGATSAAAKTGGSKLPDTSDKQPVAPLAATALLSLAAILISRAKLQPAHAAHRGMFAHTALRNKPAHAARRGKHAR